MNKCLVAMVIIMGVRGMALAHPAHAAPSTKQAYAQPKASLAPAGKRSPVASDYSAPGQPGYGALKYLLKQRLLDPAASSHGQPDQHIGGEFPLVVLHSAGIRDRTDKPWTRRDLAVVLTNLWRNVCMTEVSY